MRESVGWKTTSQKRVRRRATRIQYDTISECMIRITAQLSLVSENNLTQTCERSGHTKREVQPNLCSVINQKKDQKFHTMISLQHQNLPRVASAASFVSLASIVTSSRASNALTNEFTTAAGQIPQSSISSIASARRPLH